MLSLLIPILCGLVLSSNAFAQSNQSVYTDTLNNGWQNWSWASVNLSNSAPVHSGSASISENAGPYQALYLHHDAFDSTLYASLVFWINGGPSGGQLLQVQAELSGTAQTVVTLPALAANTWQQFTIPLASLGVQSKPNLDGFWIQDRSGTTLPTFYVDDISIAAPPPPSVVNLNVDAAQVLRTVDARHSGRNAAVWDSVFDTTTTINLLSEMGNQALRFPGGSLSDDYHWATNTTDSNTWQWATSFAKFATVATATGAQVFITVNYGSGANALGSQVWLDVNGQTEEATVLDSTGATPSTITYTVKLDPAQPLIVKRGTPVKLDLHFDMSASTIINTTVSPITATVRPILTASTQPVINKTLRTRGEFVTVDRKSVV